MSSTHQRALAPLSSTEPAATGASLEVVLLAVDVLQLPGLVAAGLLADEHLDPEGDVQEAGVQVPGDPVPAGVDDAVRRLGGVVALMLALGSSVRCGLWLMARSRCGSTPLVLEDVNEAFYRLQSPTVQGKLVLDLTS